MKRLIILGLLAFFLASCTPTDEVSNTTAAKSIACMWGGQCSN